jgi:hypothetical protein
MFRLHVPGKEPFGHLPRMFKIWPVVLNPPRDLLAEKIIPHLAHYLAHFQEVYPDSAGSGNNTNLWLFNSSKRSLLNSGLPSEIIELAIML